MKPSSRFRRIRVALCALALLPILLGGALSVHSTLLADGAKSLLAKMGLRADSAGLTELISALELYSAIGLITSLAGVSLLISILISMHRGRLGIYRNFARKLSALCHGKSAFTLNNIAFPKEDDLGNLGETLNAIIARLREFEGLRQEELLLADALTRAILNEREQALAVFDDRFALLFFSPPFAEGMRVRLAAGTRTKEIFKDITTLEQLARALGREGESRFELRQAADALIPIRCVTIARPGLSSKRLVAHFAPPTGGYT